MTRVRHFLLALVTILVATLACATQLQAQETGTIRGRIVDVLSVPIADVTVFVADRTVLSDPTGLYAVTDVPAGTYTLRASIIGYSPFSTEVTVVADDITTVDIELQLAPVELEELVAVGYGETRRRDLTGVIADVPREAMNRGRITTSEELIQGKVSGVEVVDSGEPGGGTAIRIRGGASVTSSNEPLFIVDGVPLPVTNVGVIGDSIADIPRRSPLAFINPDDIESMTVLKDASATAIYGARGANGVILITTKSGQRGLQLTYRGNVSGSSVIGGPDILGAAEYREVVQREAPEVMGVLGNADTDWRDLVERGAFGHDHNLAVSGGSEDMDYRLSFGYQKQNGVIQGTSAERISGALNYNQRLFNDRLDLQLNLLGGRNKDVFGSSRILGDATGFAPTQPVLDPGNEFGGYWEWDDPLGAKNPQAQLDLIVDDGTQWNTVGNLFGQYALPFLDDNMSANVRVGFNTTSAERRRFQPSVLRIEQTQDGDDGTLERQNPSDSYFLLDAFLNWGDVFGSSALDITGGYTWSSGRSDFPRFLAQELAFDFLGPDGVPTSGLEQTFLEVEEFRLASWFGRLNYTLLDNYLFTATVRRDGSSQFGQNEQWGTFPSAAFAWRISGESFMENSGLSDLRLRVSWGINGNDAFDAYQSWKSFFVSDSRAQYQFGDEFISTIRPSAADPNIKWEETESWNFGVDYGFLDSRIAGSVEYYRKNTDDLIFNVPIAAGTNLSNFVTTNIGSLKGSGFEFSINGNIFTGEGGGFSWVGNLNFAYNQNEITEINPFGGGAEQILVGGIAGGVGTNIQVLTPGQPINSFYTLTHIRDADGNPIYQDTNGDGVINDQDLYEDINDDGIVNQDDRSPFNSPDPDWIFGHTSLMRYKNFDASFTLVANIGNYVYNNVASNNGYFDVLRDTGAPANIHRSALAYEFQRPQFLSDVYVENASFLRLNNLELGYTLNVRSLDLMRFFVTIQNVATITGYGGIDPTAGVNGIDNNIYPRSRTIVGGVNIGF